MFDASYSRETRNGNKNTTFYGGPDYEVATPIDFMTDNFRFGGEFAKGRFFLAPRRTSASSRTTCPYVEIDNPERLADEQPDSRTAARSTTTPTFFRLWMPPDNEAYQADFTGGVTLPARHKITASLSTGDMKMDTVLHEHLDQPQPQTSATPPNPAFTIVPPYGSVEAKYDTFMAQVRFTGDPIRWLGYTPVLPQVRARRTRPRTTTSRARSAATSAPPYSAAGFTREHEGWSIESLRGEVHVTPVRGLRLGASYGAGQAHVRHPRVRRRRRTTSSRSPATTASSLVQPPRRVVRRLDRKPGDANEEAIPPTLGRAPRRPTSPSATGTS